MGDIVARRSSPSARRIAAITAVFFVLGACGRPSAAAAPRFCAPAAAPVAHRGGTEKSMENTVGAFRAAGAAGITRWELDVRFDQRDTPVVLHDETVDRVSPSTGPVSRLDTTRGRVRTDDGQH